MNRKLTAIALIAAAVLTNAGFTVLGNVFNYPDVLKEPSGVVLERFHEHQGSVSFWFAVLALSAALFAPIAIGVGRLRSDRYMRLAVPIGIAAAVVQVIGLSRWPLLVPGFANDAVNGNPATAAAAADHFHAASTILGTVIGETFGYLLTAAWTLLVVRSLRAQFAGRVFAGLGAVSALMIVLGVFSPLGSSAIDTINFGGYVLWSVWLIWFAIAILRSSSRADAHRRDDNVDTDDSAQPATDRLIDRGSPRRLVGAGPGSRRPTRQ